MIKNMISIQRWSKNLISCKPKLPDSFKSFQTIQMTSLNAQLNFEPPRPTSGTNWYWNRNHKTQIMLKTSLNVKLMLPMSFIASHDLKWPINRKKSQKNQSEPIWDSIGTDRYCRCLFRRLRWPPTADDGTNRLLTASRSQPCPWPRLAGLSLSEKNPIEKTLLHKY